MIRDLMKSALNPFLSQLHYTYMVIHANADAEDIMPEADHEKLI